MFSDLKIVELGQEVSGPFCAKLFADWGADVLKVEPLEGDAARRRRPFAADEAGIERSGLFAYLNTNKLGITLDVTSRAGHDLFERLIASADIVVENNPPAWMTEHHLGYEALSAKNSSLIMVSITPFGQDGPWRHYIGNDFVVCHGSGVGYSNGARVPDSESMPPLVVPGSIAEFLGGIAGASFTMAALLERDLNGRGLHVDVALQEVLAMHLQVDIARVTYTGEIPSRSASAVQSVPIVGQQPTADGYVDYVVRREEQWRNLVDILGNPDWATNELFADQAGRASNWDALEPLLQDQTRRFNKHQLFRESQARGIPAAPVNTIAEAADAAEQQGRGFFKQFRHPVLGPVKCPGPPVLFRAEPAQLNAAPLLGQHNRQVYCGRLGLTEDQLLSLYELRVI